MVFSPLAYPVYDWTSMAVSDLSASGAPSANLAAQLNSLFGPCGIVSIMAVCVAVANVDSKLLRLGIYFFAAMEWLCNVGYSCFPWVAGKNSSHPQNVMHLVVVVFSIAALMLIAIGAQKVSMKSLYLSALFCLAMMLIGPIGTSMLPKSVFGIFERFSTFSAVIFNAILGVHLLCGKFETSMRK